MRDYYKNSDEKEFNDLLSTEGGAWICSSPEGERPHTCLAEALKSFNYNIQKHCAGKNLGWVILPRIKFMTLDDCSYIKISAKVKNHTRNTVSILPKTFMVELPFAMMPTV